MLSRGREGVIGALPGAPSTPPAARLPRPLGRATYPRRGWGCGEGSAPGPGEGSGPGPSEYPPRGRRTAERAILTLSTPPASRHQTPPFSRASIQRGGRRWLQRLLLPFLTAPEGRRGRAEVAALREFLPAVVARWAGGERKRVVRRVLVETPAARLEEWGRCTVYVYYNSPKQCLVGGAVKRQQVYGYFDTIKN